MGGIVLQYLLPALMYSGIALVFWLLDAVLFSFYGHLDSFVGALWAEVPLYRLVLRSLVAGILIVVGLRKSKEIYCASDIIQDIGFVGNMNRPSRESAEKCQRLVFYGEKLANALKMSEEDILAYQQLCYCYDIGKITLPNCILESKETRTGWEKDRWNQHSEDGYLIASMLAPLAGCAELIRCHHERWDGSGQLGLIGNQIPLGCRIFSIVWVYDGLTRPANPYKRGLTCDEAANELRYYAHTALDPELVELFVKLMKGNGLMDGVKQGVALSFR